MFEDDFPVPKVGKGFILPWRVVTNEENTMKGDVFAIEKIGNSIAAMLD